MNMERKSAQPRSLDAVKWIDALTKDVGRRKRKMQQSPTAYAQGKECAYAELERDLATLRSKMEAHTSHE